MIASRTVLLSSLIMTMCAARDFCCLAAGRWQTTDASHLCSLCATSTDAARPPHWCGVSSHNCGQCSGGQSTWCSSSGSTTLAPATTATTTSVTTRVTTISTTARPTTSTLIDTTTSTTAPTTSSATSSLAVYGLGQCQGPFIRGRSYVNILSVTQALLQCGVDCASDPSCKYYSYGEIDVYCWLYAECPSLSGELGSGGYTTYARSTTTTTTTTSTSPSQASVFSPVTSAPRCGTSEPRCNSPCGDITDHGVRYVLCSPVRSAKRLLVTFKGAHLAGSNIMINALRLFSLGEQLDFLVLRVDDSAAVDEVVDTQGLQWYTFGAAWIKSGTEHRLLVELQREAAVDRVHMWTADPSATPEQVIIEPVDVSGSDALCAAQLVGWPSRLIRGTTNVEVIPLAAASSRLLLEFASAGGELAEELFVFHVRLYSKQSQVPFVVESMRTASGIASTPNTNKIHRGPFQVPGLPVTLSVLLQRPVQVDKVVVANIATQALVLKVAPLFECRNAGGAASSVITNDMDNSGQAGRHLAESAMVLV